MWAAPIDFTPTFSSTPYAEPSRRRTANGRRAANRAVDRGEDRPAPDSATVMAERAQMNFRVSGSYIRRCPSPST